jgi:hypothetical protein
MEQKPTSEFVQLLAVQRFWNNELIRTMSAALKAVDDDDTTIFNRQFKRLREIEMRRRKDYEIPLNKLAGKKIYK